MGGSPSVSLRQAEAVRKLTRRSPDVRYLPFLSTYQASKKLIRASDKQVTPSIDEPEVNNTKYTPFF